jgi:anti-sigma B factor antagonist
VTGAHRATSGSLGLPVRWSCGFAVMEPPAGGRFLSATALAGELCAVLDAGAEGLIVYLPGTCVFDSACLDTLMRVARRARGWGAWLRLVIPDPGVRRVVRLVALNQVMPVHASVAAAVRAAALEAAVLEAGGGLAMGRPSARCAQLLLPVSLICRPAHTPPWLGSYQDVRNGAPLDPAVGRSLIFREYRPTADVRGEEG